MPNPESPVNNIFLNAGNLSRLFFEILLVKDFAQCALAATVDFLAVCLCGNRNSREKKFSRVDDFSTFLEKVPCFGDVNLKHH